MQKFTVPKLGQVEGIPSETKPERFLRRRRAVTFGVVAGICRKAAEHTKSPFPAAVTLTPKISQLSRTLRAANAVALRAILDNGNFDVSFLTAGNGEKLFLGFHQPRWSKELRDWQFFAVCGVLRVSLCETAK